MPNIQRSNNLLFSRNQSIPREHQDDSVDKGLATKLDDLGVIPRAHVVGGENRIPQSVLCVPLVCHVMYKPAHIHVGKVRHNNSSSNYKCGRQ